MGAAATLLQPTPRGLYCAAGDFFIDPPRPVARALVTHGHSDHARAGHGAVLATAETLDIMATRYGEDFAGSRQIAALGEAVTLGDVRVTFHPAGHVLGSAQILIENAAARVVVSGDYKRDGDPTCRPFEPIACDLFVTEATFGLPVYRFPPAAEEIAKLLGSLAVFPDRAHLVGAYSLGKAQRLIALLRLAGWDRPIPIHGALTRLCALYEAHGVPLGPLVPATTKASGAFAGEIVLGPPAAMAERWSRRFADPVPIFASGWMRIRARARQRQVELPLVISDHADWEDLCTTIIETGAGEVWVTHGEEDALVHWCGTRGIAARPLRLVGYGEGEDEAAVAEGDPAAG